MSSLTHVVLFQFKKEASSQKVLETTNRPYIKSLVGGSDNSPEGAQAGITHGFVVEFATAEDRDYYVFKDPVHDAFKKAAGEVLANAIVVDFNNGSFGSAKV